jgi:transketolase
MRNIFIKNLLEAAETNPDLYLITGDLGYRALEPFRDRFPDRFLNAGIAEANMVGLAAGLALSGKRVCVYSIIPFLVFRALEQIRNDIAYQNLDVKIVGPGGGFSYGNQGPSHNTAEDVAIMRALPNMAVLCPGDKTEATLAIKAMLATPGPAYIRLGKAGEKEIYAGTPEFSIGKILPVKSGDDLTLVSTGNIIETALAAAEILEKSGLSVRILSAPSLKPFDEEAVAQAARETKGIFTVEEHGPVGGLGSAVAKILADSDLQNIKFAKFGMADDSCLCIGSQDYLRRQNGLYPEHIAAEILKQFET